MRATGIVTNLEKLYDFGPEVINVEAQFTEIPCTLKVGLEFTNNGEDFRATVLFHNVEGFRVLDEGDQLNFWKEDNMPSEWLLHIISGGWFDSEVKNDGLTVLSTINNQLKEYLVAGVGMCVNVICKGDEEPIITVID